MFEKNRRVEKLLTELNRRGYFFGKSENPKTETIGKISTVPRRRKNKSKKSEQGGGLPIRVSFIAVVMAAIAIACGHARETLSYIAAVMLHELSHATVAARLGYTLSELKIMPFGASLTGEFEGVKPRDEFLIAAAGPLSNVAFATLFIALWWLVPELFYYTEIYVTANVFTAIVNLLPVFPLDGGRAVLALACRRIPRRKAYRLLRICGISLSAVGVALSVAFFRLLNFSYFTFLTFILVSSAIPDKNSRYERLYGVSFRRQRLRNGLPIREIAVHCDATLLQLSRMLNANYFTRFCVLNDSLAKICDIDETELETMMLTSAIDSPVSAVSPKFL